ncbi:MAG: tRNA (N(6)-L-threonylcarbamoyladenosine(37)-C(2))-methylthiotransferase MtaB [Rhodospirillales bacterium]|nr:tRNA (N(6)-L-threonylcarbamoyladenosine(37)-C(2))-methylthiotransferase MtaB [Alphaproteobacteria bacterium]MBL6947135.1 tRNA (N(6)-L-threonylcarbamoyladenosine(37)-C(2))-methylthiotransferase MtaB [Rhodospirillales bacterium]
MTQPRVITLGCRLNTFESEVMRELARGGGRDAGLDDAIIINTCAVTAEAERQARQTIRRLARDNPDARIIVTGCAAQLNPDAFSEMEEVHRVLGNEEKLDPDLLAGAGPDVQVADIMTVRETAPHLISGIEGRTRAFVQIQQGCDHRCTYCIIPFARGPNRAVAADAVVAQVQTLVETGYKEVVLTGVDICSYGGDAADGQALSDLVGRVLAEAPELERLRLSTLDPAAIDDGLLRLFAEQSRLMPHLHLSLQAMDDTILKRMKRRHSRADAFETVRRAREARPDAVFGADLIAGFPTETDEMFDNSLSAVGDLGLAHLHVFPYSPRPGTPAARMPEVSGDIRKVRAAKLRTAGDKELRRFLDSRAGTTAQVLVEKDRQGLSQHYATVKLDFDADPGVIVEARVTAAGDDYLVGSRVGGRAA